MNRANLRQRGIEEEKQTAQSHRTYFQQNDRRKFPNLNKEKHSMVVEVHTNLSRPD